MRIVGYLVAGFAVSVAFALAVGWAIGQLSGDHPRRP